jgi:hypothetical protein
MFISSYAAASAADSAQFISSRPEMLRSMGISKSCLWQRQAPYSCHHYTEFKSSFVVEMRLVSHQLLAGDGHTFVWLLLSSFGMTGRAIPHEATQSTVSSLLLLSYYTNYKLSLNSQYAS